MKYISYDTLTKLEKDVSNGLYEGFDMVDMISILKDMAEEYVPMFQVTDEFIYGNDRYEWAEGRFEKAEERCHENK